MRDNLRLYSSFLAQFRKCLPGERVTRVRNLALLSTGLYLAGSVHLPRVACRLPIAGTVPSLSNRLRRFLNNPRVCVRSLYEPVARQLIAAFSGQALRLILDCTKLGFDYQVMTVAIAYHKRAVPLAWSMHVGSRGSIALRKQMALLEYVRGLLGDRPEVYLIADAGFQFVPLLQWLQRQGWHFVIRQSGHNMVRVPGADWVKLVNLGLKEGETRYLGWVRLTTKHDHGWVSMVLHWETGEEEPWYLVTDRPADWRTIRTYKLRMWVEEMYGDMKGNGLDLHTTHLRDLNRLTCLMLGVCLVYTWLVALGSRVVKHGLRRLVDRNDRRDKSYFRIGWDWFERTLNHGKPFRIRFAPYASK